MVKRLEGNVKNVLYNHEKNLKSVEKRIRNSDITEENKQLIFEFESFCFAEGSKIARVLKYLTEWKILAEIEVTSPAIEEDAIKLKIKRSLQLLSICHLSHPLFQTSGLLDPSSAHRPDPEDMLSMHTDLFSTGFADQNEAIIRHIILHQSPIYSRFYLNFTITSFSGLLLEVNRTLKLVLIMLQSCSFTSPLRMFSSIDLEKRIVTEQSSLLTAVSSSYSRSTHGSTLLFSV